jgi:hypothetical protein
MDETTNPTWDDIAVDPFAGPYRQGQENGRIAGHEVGFREGYALGRTTALNYGLELGYIQGMLQELRCCVSGQATDGEVATNKSGMDRIQRSMDNLMVALDEFPPTAAEMRSTSNGSTDRNTSAGILEGLPQDHKLDDIETPEGDAMDVEAKMQRIRARFKLLCVQIDSRAKLQLSAVLDEALVWKSSSETLAVGNATAAAADGLAANHQDSHAW